MHNNYKYIDSDRRFAAYYGDIKGEKIIAVDLEADSMHHFKERVCLIQLADKKNSCVLDPFKIMDFSRLKILMENRSIKKVFHGSDFDIRSLDREYGIRVNNLFDTEIACKFLGIKERGLKALLKKYFNVDQDKKYQKKDWSVRPLPEEMLAYSIIDVLYLIDLAQILTGELKRKKRLAWAEEEFQRQTEVRYELNNRQYHFLRFKGAGKMDKKTLAVLEHLLAMRMKIAEKKDLPLFKVLGADQITNIALEKPLTLNHLKQTSILTKKQTGMYGEMCIKAVDKALKLDESDMPQYPASKARRLKNVEHMRIKYLKIMRRKMSEKYGMEPGFLLNNAMIIKISVKNPLTKAELENIQSIRKWQVEALSDEIFSVLQDYQ